jgi:hypothetical protein
MKTLEPRLALLAALLAGTLVGCSMTGTKSGGISASIRKSLDHAGFKDVSAGQDPGKSVVTLSGLVGSEDEKLQAEAIAKSIAPGEAVSNQMVVAVPGDDDSVNDVKVVNPDLNKGSERTWMAFSPLFRRPSRGAIARNTRMSIYTIVHRGLSQ